MKTFNEFLSESVRDKMTPKSDDEIRNIIKKIIGRDTDYIEVKIPEPKEIKKVKSLLKLSDEYNIDIKEYDTDNLIVCGDITNVFNFIKFYVDYTLINKRNNRQFYIDYIKNNITERITESIRDKMTPKSQSDISTILQDKSQWKQFKIACENGMMDLLKRLLKEDDNDDIHDVLQLGIDIARRKGQSEIVYFLMSYKQSNKFQRKEMLNEGIRDMMTPKKEEDIIKTIRESSPDRIIDILLYYSDSSRPDNKYFNEEEIKDILLKTEPNKTLKKVEQNPWLLKLLLINRDITDFDSRVIHQLLYDSMRRKGYMDIVKYLIDTIDDINRDWSAYLRFAVDLKVDEEIIKYLLKKGADSNLAISLWQNQDVNKLENIKRLKNIQRQVLTESIRDKMTPKSDEEIDKAWDESVEEMIQLITHSYKITDDEAIQFLNDHIDSFEWRLLEDGYSVKEIFHEWEYLLYNTFGQDKMKFNESVRDMMTPKTKEDMMPIIIDKILDNYSEQSVCFTDTTYNGPRVILNANTNIMNTVSNMFGNGIYLTIMNPKYYTAIKEFFWKRNIAFSRVMADTYRINSHDKIRTVLTKLVEDVYNNENDKFIIQKFTNMMR